MGRQDARVSLSGHNVAHDPQPRLARDVAHHQRQLHVHLNERLLHPLDAAPAVLNQRLAMPQVGPQRDDPRRRPKAPAHQPDDMQIAEPLAIRHITLAAGDVLDVTRVDQQHLKPTRLENLIQRNPVDARRFHGHTANPTRGQPVRQTVQIVGERDERPHALRIPVRWDRHEMFRRPAVDSRGIRIETSKNRRGSTRLRRPITRATHHRRLLALQGHRASAIRDAEAEQSPKRDHDGTSVVSPVMTPHVPGPR